MYLLVGSAVPSRSVSLVVVEHTVEYNRLHWGSIVTAYVVVQSPVVCGNLDSIDVSDDSADGDGIGEVAAGLGDRLASTVEVTYLDSIDVSEDSVDGDGIGEVKAGLKEPKVEVVFSEESFSHLPGGQTCQHCDNVSPRHHNLR